MRKFVAVVVLLTLAFAAGAEDKKEEKGKVDKAKLVGKWTFVKTDAEKGPPEGVTIKLEFVKDGKYTFSYTAKEKENKVEGTYTVEGDQLTTVMKRGDKESKNVRTIKELTDKKLVLVSKRGDKTETTEFKK